MSSPVVIMDRGNNTTCIINLHGSTIVSWRVNNQEQLFVSKKSVFDGRQPIRGGINFVFPQVFSCDIFLHLSIFIYFKIICYIFIYIYLFVVCQIFYIKYRKKDYLINFLLIKQFLDIFVFFS